MREIIMIIFLAILFYALLMQIVENALACFQDEDSDERPKEKELAPIAADTSSDGIANADNSKKYDIQELMDHADNCNKKINRNKEDKRDVHKK